MLRFGVRRARRRVNVARPAIPAREGENSGVARLVARRGPNWHAPLPPSLSRPIHFRHRRRRRRRRRPSPCSSNCYHPSAFSLSVHIGGGRRRRIQPRLSLSRFSLFRSPLPPRKRVRVCIPSSCAPGNRRRRIVLTRVSRRHLLRYAPYDNELSCRTEFRERNIVCEIRNVFENSFEGGGYKIFRYFHILLYAIKFKIFLMRINNSYYFMREAISLFLLVVCQYLYISDSTLIKLIKKSKTVVFSVEEFIKIY